MNRGVRYVEDDDEQAEQQRILRRLGDAFTDEGSNVFLTKINYWLPL